MECNKTFLWFGVDFIALRYTTVIVICVIKIYTDTNFEEERLFLSSTSN